MPLLFPGAVWRPMPGSEKRTQRRKGRGVGFHIAVSEAPSIYGINLGTGNDAHLYVRRDGGVEQNIDLDLVSYAGAAGNSTMIWVETQGGTTAADVKSGRWTAAQAETLAQIAAWAHRTEGVPLQVMPDSKPASRGIGTHRLGIKHSRGVGAVPGWLIAGGEVWSSAVGKECAGDARIAQVPEIVTRAQQIVNGQSQEDDMAQADIDEIQRKLSLLLGVELKERDPREKTPGEQVLKGEVAYGVEKLTGGKQHLDAVLAEVFSNARALVAAPGVDVDEEAIAAALAPMLPAAVAGAVATMPGDQLAAIAKAVNDEADRRNRDGDPATGPVS